MNRSLLTLSSLAAVLLIAGCASKSTSSAPAASAPAEKAPVAAAPAAPAAVVKAPVAVAPAAAASDVAMAEKLKGQWTGEWVMPGFGQGKFVLIAASVDGADIKGEAHWYGTASGDLKWPLRKAVVIKGVLNAEQDGDTKFKLKMKSDTELVGTWDIKGYTGDLSLKR